MASCSLSPSAGLEFQRGNRLILPDGGGKELSRSSRIEPPRNPRVARTSITISTSTSAAPIERIEPRRNPRVARASLTVSSSTSAAPIERIEPRRNPRVARASLTVSSSTSAAPIERIEPRRNPRVARASLTVSSSTSAAPIERIEPRRNPCAARASLAISTSASPIAPIESKTALLHLTSFPDRERDRNPVTAESLDVWIRDSIGEIVRHIGEAPFLVRIYSPAVSGGARIEREAAATAERWPRIRERWDREGRTPDGVILVEELRVDEEAEGGGDEKARWGLVVQGKGMDCAACYVLNTCRVRSSGGFCTHFCLVRAKCFGEAPEVQLRKAWLQGELGIS